MMGLRSRWFAVVAGALAALTACGDADPAPPAAWDFFGVVAAVEFEEPPVEEAGVAQGGPDSDYLSGALTLTFTDGRSVAVPTGTPGGNLCRELSVTGARNQECVVAGALDEDGLVDWFQVVRVENRARSRGGGRQVRLFGLESFDGASLTIRGVSFSVRGDATVECLDDASTIGEALQADRPLVADVSIPDLTVTNVWCVYDE